MADFTLTRKQKNDIFSVLEKTGLNPADFYWKREHSCHRRSQLVSRLSHKHEEVYFIFDLDFQSPGSLAYDLHYRPGLGVSLGSSTWRYNQWDAVMSTVKAWAQQAQEEITVPDMWDQLSKQRPLADWSSIESLSDTPIPDDEAAQIAEQLWALSCQASTSCDLTEEQREFVQEKFDYLGTEINKQGRRAFIYLVIGVVFQIAGFLASDPDKVERFYNLIRVSFRHITGLFGSA